jgi:fructan beta-fructosidase
LAKWARSHDSAHGVTVALRGGELRLRAYVDRTSVEVFVQDGEVCLTEQVFAPEGGTAFTVGSYGGMARVSFLEWRPMRRARAVLREKR